ncbi:dihydrofolate reductase [Chitinophaga sp. SYP-B3965]|uniref:dihydrofolate reductase family protein n=1 Tax=Chitinophaga sp. SYP-B3965 TaxID=2663120 RepID=UPI001299599E|nr:dihydrofolate reductase family protein [Chitinophaga sp. SYP-B3965]MRG48356.1 dihydrofolate reductase [Chitinophaga sp. SYP-B3965]
MRKIILDLAVTLDGFIEGPNGEIDWISEDPDATFDNTFGELLSSIDTIFYGRKSYDLWGNFQPDENAPPMIQELYQAIHSKKKYVFSHTKTTMNDVPEILQQPGKDIWLYGGGQLITSFMNAGLVDVFRLAVFPVILGAGKPLFKDIQERVGLKLNEVKSSKMGVLMLNYDKVG